MHGGIVWFTGLSGAGKSTIASAVGAQIAGRALEILDGDDIRTFLSTGLTFTRVDRDTNVRRIAYVARLLAKHGVLVFVAAIAPYASTRAEIRLASQSAGHAFLEVFVDASLETVTQRDVKGLYKRALAGEIPNFTGVSDPYDRPETPELVVPSDRETPEASAARVLELLRERSLA